LYIPAFTCLVYAFAMLWLGSRKLVRFQAVGEFAGNDLLARSPGTAHLALMKFLRCRPVGVCRNLLRKEARLLWPALLLTLVCVVVVICLAAFQLLPRISREKLAVIAAVVVIVSNSLSIILAGSLSMGEERTLGTQSWHQTLPVSAGLQWLIKLAASISVSFGSLVLTVALAQILFGEPFVKLLPGRQDMLGLFLLSSLLTFAAFWCSCAVNGTVGAVLWTFPALGVVLFCINRGISLAGTLANAGTLDSVISRFHPFPHPSSRFDPLWLLVACVPPLLVAFVQTYFLFHREVNDNFLSVIRLLLPVALVALLFSLSSGLFIWIPFRAEFLLHR
jgi:hypothetical protein